jgi:hypothetical protein
MHETGSEQESCANFTPAMQSIQSDFSARRSMFLSYLLYGSSKLMILDALERMFEGASEY